MAFSLRHVGSVFSPMRVRNLSLSPSLSLSLRLSTATSSKSPSLSLSPQTPIKPSKERVTSILNDFINSVYLQSSSSTPTLPPSLSLSLSPKSVQTLYEQKRKEAGMTENAWEEAVMRMFVARMNTNISNKMYEHVLQHVRAFTLLPLTPNSHFFNTLLRAATSVRDTEALAAFTGEMCQHQIPLDVFSYTQIVQTFAGAGRVDDALVIVDHFLRDVVRAPVPETLSATLVPNRDAKHTSLLQSLHLDTAARGPWLIDSIDGNYSTDGLREGTDKRKREINSKRFRPNAVMFDIVLNAMAKNNYPNMVKVAKALHDTMTQLKIPFDPYTYIGLIKVYGRTKDSKRILRIYEDSKIEHSDILITANCLNVLLRNFRDDFRRFSAAKRNETDDKVQLNQKINQKIQLTPALQRDFDGIMEIFNEDLKALLPVQQKKVVDSARTVFNTLILTLSELQQHHSATAVFSSLSLHRVFPDRISYNTLLRSCNNSYTSNTGSSSSSSSGVEIPARPDAIGALLGERELEEWYKTNILVRADEILSHDSQINTPSVHRATPYTRPGNNTSSGSHLRDAVSDMLPEPMVLVSTPERERIRRREEEDLDDGSLSLSLPGVDRARAPERERAGSSLSPNVQRCLHIFRHMLNDSSVSPDVWTYTTVANVLIKDGETIGAIGVLDLMKSNACEPTTVTYNVLLSGLASVPKYSWMCAILKRMEADGIVPDEVTWNAVLIGASLSIQTKQILSPYTSLSPIHKFIDAHREIIPRSPGTLSAMFYLYGRMDIGVTERRRRYAERIVALFEEVFPLLRSRSSSLSLSASSLSLSQLRRSMLFALSRHSETTTQVEQLWQFLLGVCDTPLVNWTLVAFALRKAEEVERLRRLYAEMRGGLVERVRGERGGEGEAGEAAGIEVPGYRISGVEVDAPKATAMQSLPLASLVISPSSKARISPSLSLREVGYLNLSLPPLALSHPSLPDAFAKFAHEICRGLSLSPSTLPHTLSIFTDMKTSHVLPRSSTVFYVLYSCVLYNRQDVAAEVCDLVREMNPEILEEEDIRDQRRLLHLL